MFCIINKQKVFDAEVSWISDSKIRQFVLSALSKCPDYFFHEAASSTGKYHPAYSLGDGGLVRHTKAAVGIANALLDLEQNKCFGTENRDIILAAIILHDSIKHGLNGSKFTVASHPVEAASFIKNDSELSTMLEESQLTALIGAISSHMGEWNTDFKTKKEILPKPKTDIEKFVHMCDYLASRKYLIYDFGDDYYNPNDYEIEEVSPLKEGINTLIEMCKEKISAGANRDDLYAVIAEHNNGKKNPNTISDKAVLIEIIKCMEEL